MARHSHWHNIQLVKGKVDAKRAASFTKLTREITIATREKGADPEMNARLRVAIEHAREASMPKDGIERAIQKGSGTSEEGQLETLTYEAYAPGGTALIIECVTDSRNRSASEVKHLLSKNGGTIATSGAVTYLFDRYATFLTNAFPVEARESIELALIEAGAAQLNEQGDGMEILGEPTNFSQLAETLKTYNLTIREAGFAWVPKTLIETDEATAQQVTELIEILERDDDVSRVFTNLA